MEDEHESQFSDIEEGELDLDDAVDMLDNLLLVTFLPPTPPSIHLNHDPFHYRKKKKKRKRRKSRGDP